MLCWEITRDILYLNGDQFKIWPIFIFKTNSKFNSCDIIDVSAFSS